MSNALTKLLESDTVKRGIEDYERTFGDYIEFAGGRRIGDVCSVPANTLNADYLVETDLLELVIELKQVNKYDKSKSVDRYFEKLLHKGQIREPKQLSPTRIRIDRSSLTTSQWNHFYRKFRPNVAGQLDKAARQLKSTAGFLPVTSRRRVYGVILVNTGDFNLPVDLMHRLVEFCAKRKWKAGRFTHIDFVICVMLDMLKTGQHPVFGRCIVRTFEDDPLIEGVRHLVDRWIRYGAAAVGAQVEFDPEGGGEAPLELSDGIAGKIFKLA